MEADAVDPETGYKTFKPLQDDYMTQSEMVSYHGRCGDLLHARNPFRPQLVEADYQLIFNEFKDWHRKLQNLLEFHAFRATESEVFVCRMNYPIDGRVHIQAYVTDKDKTEEILVEQAK